MHIKDKIVCITGSTRGIGRELAAQCLAQGARVIIHGRNPVQARAAQRKLSDISPRVDSVGADIAFATQRARMIDYLRQTYGKIDVFVSNAAVSMRGAFEECTPALLNNIIATNVSAPLMLTNAIIPLLNAHGSIVFVSSGAGLYGFPQVIPYSVTKMCLNALHQGLDIELAERHIHVGIVYLDFVENDPEKTILDNKNSHIQVKRRARLTQEHAARAILSTVRHHHRTRYVGRGAKLVAFMARYCPHMLHRLLIIKRHAIHAHRR